MLQERNLYDAHTLGDDVHCYYILSGCEGKVDRILRPDDCQLSTEQYLRSLPVDGNVTVFRDPTSFHGLTGKKSNHAKRQAHVAFGYFVGLYRSPIGRTADKDGRMHSDAYYLNANWQVWRLIENTVDPDVRENLYADFKHVLKARNIAVPSSRSILRWFEEDFGPTMRVGGYLKPSIEHTAVFRTERMLVQHA